MRGKTISIFMPDSNPRGIKICEIKNSIVKALFIPRSKLDEVTKRQDVSGPAIYFLFGKNSQNGKLKVYIGEAESFIKRIKQHNNDGKKDFWNTAIGFLSEKNNINKAHIKYLESYCCKQAQLIEKCDLENSTNPTQSSLTEQDEDFVLSFFDDLKILISTLGFPIFEETKKEKENIFVCKGKEAFAQGEYSDDGMVVFKGSIANLEEAAGSKQSSINMKKNLVENGIMHEENKVYIFDEDYTFSSPSMASNTILGRSSNGWTEWRDEKGRTLDERYRKNL